MLFRLPLLLLAVVLAQVPPSIHSSSSPSSFSSRTPTTSRTKYAAPSDEFKSALSLPAHRRSVSYGRSLPRLLSSYRSSDRHVVFDLVHKYAKHPGSSFHSLSHEDERSDSAGMSGTGNTRNLGSTAANGDDDTSKSSLPSASFFSRPFFRRHRRKPHFVSPEHFALLRRHDALRFRELVERLTNPASGGNSSTVPSVSGAGNRNSSSVDTTPNINDGGAIFKLKGNSDPSIAGLYWANVELGTPPTSYALQIDTGSDLSWVDCAPCESCPKKSDLVALARPFDPLSSNTSLSVDCSSHTCEVAQSTQSALDYLGCLGSNPGDYSCYYRLKYGDGSNTTGYLLRDRASFNSLNGAKGGVEMVFGCSYDQRGALVSYNHLVDGLMGLGQGPLSLPSQLFSLGVLSERSFAHCLGGEKDGGGSLILGRVVEPGLKFTPLMSQTSNHYLVALEGLSVSGQRIDGIDASSFGDSISSSPSSSSPNAVVGRTLFDSGTTLAIFPNSVFELWKSTVHSQVNGLSVAPDTILPGTICYDYSDHKYSDLPKFFPNVTLHFRNADMELTPSNYLIVQSNFWSSIACLAWQGLAFSGKELTVIGDIILKDHLVVMDTTFEQVGFMPFDCSGGSVQVQDNQNATVTIVVGSSLSSSSSSASPRLSSLFPKGRNSVVWESPGKRQKRRQQHSATALTSVLPRTMTVAAAVGTEARRIFERASRVAFNNYPAQGVSREGDKSLPKSPIESCWWKGPPGVEKSGGTPSSLLERIADPLFAVLAGISLRVFQLLHWPLLISFASILGLHCMTASFVS